MPATSPLHQTFCSNVRMRRVQLDLTQEDMAERLGISQPAYAAIESGRREPGISVIDKVAKALELPPALLLAPQEVEVA